MPGHAALHSALDASQQTLRDLRPADVLAPALGALLGPGAALLGRVLQGHAARPERATRR